MSSLRETWLTDPTSRLQRRPPTVQYILKHRERRMAYMKGNTPLAALYRMYEYFVLDQVIELRNEIEDFFDEGPTWPVANISDPRDPDPARYAILAVMTIFLVDAFNRNIGKGIPRDAPAMIGTMARLKELRARPKIFEKPPPWAAKVPKLRKTLVIPDREGVIPDGTALSRYFWEKNIVAQAPHVHFT
ncbi:MAG: hypothetical protein M1821_003075 [Bathelium mastoideum]|nr:MAG: hypothetical protein M1821_003075 [Bathelium mastoideum]